MAETATERRRVDFDHYSLAHLFILVTILRKGRKRGQNYMFLKQAPKMVLPPSL
jgi:hypothetical protein